MSILSRVAVVLALTLTIAGCGHDDSDEAKFRPACPSLSLLGDAGDVVRYNGAGRDVTDLQLNGRILAVPATCKPGDKGFVLTTMKVRMSLLRGPAAPSRQATVTYFVSVTQGDKVLDQQDYPITVSFPPNVDRVGIEGEEITLKFPVTPKKPASDYQIYVGYRLTPDELATNRQKKPL
jgi:hypothetical protein